MLNGLDLFSGIGGIALALRDYVRVRAYCEIDRYAQAVLLSRMGCGDLPWAPIWDDVRTLSRDMLPGIDIITAGFPCQDISCAGNGAGLEGERSGLFFEVARLVGEIRPSFVFLENVPAIRTRGADVVTGRLADLGYDCRWDNLPANAVGAPHKRERWFCLARRRLPNTNREHDKSDIECLEQAPQSTRKQEWRDGLERVGSEISQPTSSFIGRNCQWFAAEPNVGRVANGVPARVDRIKALGNAVVPLCAKTAFERLLGVEGGMPPRILGRGVMRNV